jgi:hypothetical protein
VTRDKSQTATKRDWRISATLLAVWLVALLALGGGESDIPRSMLVIATIFFVMLIPAMNDLVSSMDRRRRAGQTEPESDELESN